MHSLPQVFRFVRTRKMSSKKKQSLVVVILGVLILAGDTVRVVDAIKHQQEEGQALTTMDEANYSGLRRALLSAREELFAGAGGSCKGSNTWRKKSNNKYKECNANSKCGKTEQDGCACNNGYYITKRAGKGFPVCEKCPAGEYAVWSHSNNVRGDQSSCTKCPSGCTSAPGSTACYSASESYLSSMELLYADEADGSSVSLGEIEAYIFTYGNGTIQSFRSCDSCQSRLIEFDSANPPIMIEVPFVKQWSFGTVCKDSTCIGNGEDRRQLTITFADKSQTEYGLKPGTDVVRGYRLCNTFDKTTEAFAESYQIGSTTNGPITYLTRSRPRMTGGCKSWPSKTAPNSRPLGGAGGPGWCT